jgi:biotin synthase-like enzyme
MSIGKISDESFCKLKEVSTSIRKMHHNLEISTNFYPNICSIQHLSRENRYIKNKNSKKFWVSDLFGRTLRP